MSNGNDSFEKWFDKWYEERGRYGWQGQPQQPRYGVTPGEYITAEEKAMAAYSEAYGGEFPGGFDIEAYAEYLRAGAKGPFRPYKRELEQQYQEEQAEEPFVSYPSPSGEKWIATKGIPFDDWLEQQGIDPLAPRPEVAPYEPGPIWTEQPELGLPAVEPVEERKIKDIWDAFYLGALEMGHRTKQYFQFTLPALISQIGAVPVADREEWFTRKEEYIKLHPELKPKVEAEAKEHQELEEAFKTKYAEAQARHQVWLKEHPELKPRPEWAKGTIETIKENPKVLLDPAYVGFIAAESAAFTITFLGTTLGVTAATGNPFLGLAAGVAITTPAQSQDLYEDLIASGATVEQAAQLAVPIGAVISSVEIVGAFPLLRVISTPFAQILRRNITREVTKQTVAGLAKKGLVTFSQVEIGEVLEEITQGAIQDATVKTFDENRNLLENIPETVVRTAIATLPFALVGVGGRIRGELARPPVAPPEVAPPTVEAVPVTALPTEAPPMAPEATTLGRTPSEWTGSMVDLQDADIVADIAFRDDMVRQWANNLPEIKGLIRILNPSAVANTPAERSIIVRATLKDEGKQKSQGVIAYLEELGTQEKTFGKVADDGTIASGVLKGVHPNEIRTYPGRYDGKLTDEQKQWIKRAEDIETAKLDFLTRNGIEINELSFEEGGRYAGRRVYGKAIEGDVIETAFVGVGPARIGAKVAAEKQRTFENIDEAIQAGYRYLPEDEALYLNVQGAYNRVTDAKMADWLLARVPWRTTGANEELILAAEQATLKYKHSQLLLAALNRAVRGERVPSATINSIARSYPAQAEELSGLIPLIQEGAPTAKKVRNLRNVASGLVESNKQSSQRAINARARDRERAQLKKYDEASLPGPVFTGKILTGPEAKETAEVLRKTFEAGFSKALGEVNKLNAISRYFMLAGDISPMTIQLIFLIGANPKTYGQAGAGLVRAIFDPRFHSKYLTKHKATIDKHPNLLLTKAGATEFTEAMARGGWLSGKQTLLPQAESYWKNLGLIVPRTLGKVGGTLLSPFQRGFEAGLDVAGIEMAEAYDHLCTTPEATADVDQFINEFRGVTSSARIGVSAHQQQIETASVLAPRYNRAIATLFLDLGKGGIRGSLARKSLAKGVAALSVLAILISIARGEDKDEVLDHLNPNSSNFFTWDITGQKVGPGSKVRSVVKVFAQSADNPESLFQFSMDNPAFRFARGNMAPVPGAGIELITGRSYIGDPTRDGMLSFSKEILGGNLLPIWVQSVLLEGGDLKGRTARGVAEFFGGRGYPEPVWNEVGRLRDRYAKTDFDVKYEELNREQADKLRDNHPDLIDLEEKAGLETAKRGTEEEKWFYNEKLRITKERDDALEQAATITLNGMMTKRDYDNERKYARAGYSAGMSTLWSARENLDAYAIKQIEKWYAESQKLEDVALDKYKEYQSALITASELPRDWDRIEQRLETYLAKFPKKTQEYILRNENRWMNKLPPNARQIEQLRLEGIEDESWWTNYRKYGLDITVGKIDVWDKLSTKAQQALTDYYERGETAGIVRYETEYKTVHKAWGRGERYAEWFETVMREKYKEQKK